MRQRPWGEPAGKAAGDIVTEQECREYIMAGAPHLLADRQNTGQNLHRGLAGNQAEAFAQLDRSAGNAVQQRRGSRIMGRPAGRIYRGPRARGSRQTLAQLPHLRPFAAG
jgi:hypothetical protein